VPRGPHSPPPRPCAHPPPPAARRSPGGRLAGSVSCRTSRALPAPSMLRPATAQRARTVHTSHPADRVRDKHSKRPPPGHPRPRDLDACHTSAPPARWRRLHPAIPAPRTSSPPTGTSIVCDFLESHHGWLSSRSISPRSWPLRHFSPTVMVTYPRPRSTTAPGVYPRRGSDRWQAVGCCRIYPVLRDQVELHGDGGIGSDVVAGLVVIRGFTPPPLVGPLVCCVLVGPQVSASPRL